MPYWWAPTPADEQGARSGVCASRGARGANRRTLSRGAPAEGSTSIRAWHCLWLVSPLPPRLRRCLCLCGPPQAVLRADGQAAALPEDPGGGRQENTCHQLRTAFPRVYLHCLSLCSHCLSLCVFSLPFSAYNAHTKEKNIAPFGFIIDPCTAVSLTVCCLSLLIQCLSLSIR